MTLHGDAAKLPPDEMVDGKLLPPTLACNNWGRGRDCYRARMSSRPTPEAGRQADGTTVVWHEGVTLHGSRVLPGHFGHDILNNYLYVFNTRAARAGGDSEDGSRRRRGAGRGESEDGSRRRRGGGGPAAGDVDSGGGDARQRPRRGAAAGGRRRPAVKSARTRVRSRRRHAAVSPPQALGV